MQRTFESEAQFFIVVFATLAKTRTLRGLRKFQSWGVLYDVTCKSLKTYEVMTANQGV